MTEHQQRKFDANLIIAIIDYIYMECIRFQRDTFAGYSFFFLQSSYPHGHKESIL